MPMRPARDGILQSSGCQFSRWTKQQLVARINLLLAPDAILFESGDGTHGRVTYTQVDNN